MSAMSELYMDIADEIDRGELSFQQIAVKYGVSFDEVDEIAEDIRQQIDCDDSDDGYALASAGFGMDEDYVMDNDYFDDY